MHRDLKPQNILIGTRPKHHEHEETEYIVKLADFGLSRTYGFAPRPLTTLVVTLWYRAPELLLGCDLYDKTVDIWSVGCILLELAHPNKAVAFPGMNTLDQLFKIFLLLGTPSTAPTQLGAGPSYPELYWPEIANFPYYSVSFPQWPPRAWDVIAPRLDAVGHQLVAQMLAYAPSTRIQATNALQHDYFERSSSRPATPVTSSPDTDASSTSATFYSSPVGTTATVMIGATPPAVLEVVDVAAAPSSSQQQQQHQLIPIAIPWTTRTVFGASSSSLGCTSDEASETSSSTSDHHPRAESIESVLTMPPAKRSRRRSSNEL
jgi:serine/threonine protein kinase